MDIPISSLELLFCYSHEDRSLRDELDAHLTGLKHQQLITSWYDGKISPGTEWEQEIAAHLGSADIILLLISASFLASTHCYNIEMKQALERHEAGATRVLPIIVRAVYWDGEPFSKLHVLPTDARAVTSWQNRDEAWRNVTTGIHAAVKDLQVPLSVPYEVTALPVMPQNRALKPQTLGEFLKQFIGLQTNLDKILVLGYWCEIKQGQSYFTSEDILARYKELREKKPANIKRDLNLLVARGFLIPPDKPDAGTPKYALSSLGIKEVESKMSQLAKRR